MRSTLLTCNHQTDAKIGLTSEEQTSVRPLQRRARKLISPVESKVTFTCHHAGSYKTKHSNAVPKDRLRLNVKTSVKCNCPAKVTLTEMQDGECRVLYVWKHEGHGESQSHLPC